MGDSEVIPAVRVPRRLWLYLETLRKKKMYVSMTELVREALREYVERHRHEVEQDLRVVEAILALEESDKLDAEREKMLIKLAEEIRSRH